MLDFDRVQTALEGLSATIDAAEAHGTLCGLLIDNAGMTDWLGRILDDLPEKADLLAGERLLILQQLFDLSREQMNIDDLSFELLLPDETDDFAIRLLGLSTWCQGFVYAIGSCARFNQDSLDEACRECLSDLLEISKLSHNAEPGDEAEQQYFEVVEHVRMTTLLLNELLNPVMPASTLQ